MFPSDQNQTSSKRLDNRKRAHKQETFERFTMKYREVGSAVYTSASLDGACRQHSMGHGHVFRKDERQDVLEACDSTLQCPSAFGRGVLWPDRCELSDKVKFANPTARSSNAADCRRPTAHGRRVNEGSWSWYSHLQQDRSIRATCYIYSSQRASPRLEKSSLVLSIASG